MTHAVGIRDDASAITVWRFEDAPAILRLLSNHGGDEDWLAIVPRALASYAPEGWPDPEDRDASSPLPGWLWSGSSFGVFRVSVYPHPASAQHVVVIGAHA